MVEYHYNNDELKSKLTTISSQLKTLADGYRDLTKVSNQLSLFDMIGLQKHLALVKNSNIIKNPPEEYLVDGTEAGNYNDWCFNQYYIDVDTLKNGDNFTVSIKEANLLVDNGKTNHFAVGIFNDNLSINFGISTSVYGNDLVIPIEIKGDPTNLSIGPYKFLIYCGVQGSTAGNKAVYKGLKLEVGDLSTPL